jgi:hypothetical protein
MKKLLSGITACLALATTILVSCNKTGKEQNTPHPERLKKISAQFRYTDFPKNENGLLVFRDQAHYDGYIDFLNVAVDSMDTKDTTVDINSVLQDIENGLGFTSIRKTSHEEYIRQDIIGWSSLEAIPDEHFILAQDIRSTLNIDLDVQIGTEILHYVSKDFAVRVDAGNKSLLEQFKRLPTNVSLSDITLLDPSRRGSSIIELTGDGFIFGRQKPTGASIGGPFPERVDACNRPGYLRFVNLSLDDNGSREAYFTINFGDNSPTVNVGSYGHYVTGNYFVPDFFHQYPVPSGGTINYTMTITAHYNNGAQSAMDTRQIAVSSDVGCAVKFKDSDWQYTQIPNTNRHVGGKLWMQNLNHDPNGNPHLRVVAYSKLVKENSNGSFSSFKGEMYLELSCEVKESQNCTTWDHLAGSGWDSNDNNQTLHRTASGAPGAADPAWAMSKSKHGYKHNGIWYWKEITLYPCN